MNHAGTPENISKNKVSEQYAETDKDLNNADLDATAGIRTLSK